MSTVKKVLYFIGDKLLYPLLLFEKSNELKQYRLSYEYTTNFLGEHDFGKRYEIILQPLVKYIGGIDKVESIYMIKSILFTDTTEKTIDFFIQKRLFALLQYYEVDDHNIDDFQLFNSKNLRVYLVKKYNSKNCCIYSAELYSQQLHGLKTYPELKISSRLFKKRQLVYDKEKRFVSI